jgi:uncharacterized protein (DUF1684 family)
MNTSWMAPAIAASLVLATAATGQLSVGLTAENAAILQYEPLRVTISLQNNTGVRVVLDDAGQGSARLRFNIQREDERFVLRNNQRPWMTMQEIKPGERRDVTIDLLRWFDVATASSYTISADVEWKGVKFSSAPVNVEVVTGMPISTTEAGLVGDENRIRTYGLKYWNRGGREHLFLVVEEPASGMNYGVYDLGMLIRVYQPKVVIDVNGRVKITHQSGPRRYTRTGFDSLNDEVRFVDQTHHLENGDPYPSEENAQPSIKLAPIPTPEKKPRKRIVP